MKTSRQSVNSPDCDTVGEFSKTFLKGGKLLVPHSNKYGAVLTLTSHIQLVEKLLRKKQLSAGLHYSKHMSTSPEKEETLFS